MKGDVSIDSKFCQSQILMKSSSLKVTMNYGRRLIKSLFMRLRFAAEWQLLRTKLDTSKRHTHWGVTKDKRQKTKKYVA